MLSFWGGGEVSVDQSGHTGESLQEAFHDNIDSKGEVDALAGTEALTVDRGDVLRDPKVKGYQHPTLAVKW